MFVLWETEIPKNYRNTLAKPYQNKTYFGRLWPKYYTYNYFTVGKIGWSILFFILINFILNTNGKKSYVKQVSHYTIILKANVCVCLLLLHDVTTQSIWLKLRTETESANVFNS